MIANVFTWRQKLILRAASRVDYLPFSVRDTSNIPNGVFGSLVDRGFLRQCPTGWELTEDGRRLNLWWTQEDRTKKGREEKVRLEWEMTQLPRYYTKQSDKAWLVLDRHATPGEGTINLRTRREARDRARRLNAEDREERGLELISTDGEKV